jgi:hypothetical protein
MRAKVIQALSASVRIAVGFCGGALLGHALYSKELSRQKEAIHILETDLKAEKTLRESLRLLNNQCVQMHTWESDEGNPTTVITITTPGESK